MVKKLKFLLFVAVVAIRSFSVNAAYDVKVSGLRRLDASVVQNIIGVSKYKNITDKEINDIVVKLYNYGFFKDVKVALKGQTLNVNVLEADIVGKVEFNGYDKIKLDDLKNAVKTAENKLLNNYTLKQDTEAIKVLYKRLGLANAVINVKTILQKNGKYDVIFEITEDEKLYIDSISFTGNKTFSDSKLQENIMSKEYHFWKIFELFDTYDEERIAYDAELLRQFYTGLGFLDFKVLSFNGEPQEKANWYDVKFDISEGERYKIGNVNINTTISDLDVAPLYEILLTKTGNFYDESLVKRTEKDITKNLEAKGFVFTNIDINKKTNRKEKKVDIDFVIKPAKKIIINNINITNNVRTYDRIIRGLLDFEEQDVFNSSKFFLSKQKLMATGFFENVNITPSPVDGMKDKVNIIVDVKEKSTGELSFGLGWSSLNSGFLEFGIRENNFRGKGQTLGFTTNVSSAQDNYSISFMEPNLYGRDLLGGVDLYYNRYKRTKTYGYDIDTLALVLRLGWKYNDNLSHTISWSARREIVKNISSKLSKDLLEGVGNNNIFKIGNNFSYTNQIVDYINDTKTGHIISLQTDYAGLGGSKHYLKNYITAKQFYSFWDNQWQFKMGINAGYIQPLNNSILARSDRFMLGGNTLRGFDYNGVGAKSRKNKYYALGGDWSLDGAFQLNFPLGFPKSAKVSGYIFYDWGKLGKPKIKKPKDMLYDDVIRTSIGYGIFWNSPIGPINFSWGYPITYSKHDTIEHFCFSIGTDF